jgi:hemolysin D
MSEIGQQGQDDLVYAARISLDKRQLRTGDSGVDLGPGEDRIPAHHARYEHDVLRER